MMYRQLINEIQWCKGIFSGKSFLDDIYLALYYLGKNVLFKALSGLKQSQLETTWKNVTQESIGITQNLF